MFLTPYETLACQLYDTRKITREIDRLKIEKSLITLKTPVQRTELLHVFGIPVDDEEIPAFTQPLKYHDEYMGQSPVYIVDTRLYFKQTKEKTLQITNVSEYNSIIKRALLNVSWDVNGPASLKVLGDLPAIVFIHWVSDLLAKRFGLNPIEQGRVQTLAFVYWNSLFEVETDTLDEKRKNRLLVKLHQLLPVSTSVSSPIIEQTQWMFDIQQFVDGLKEHVGTTRLEKLSPGFFFSMLSGSWFGLNVKETVAVALEHPPTFIALIDAALNSRNFKKSLIGGLVYDYDKKDRGRNFINNIQRIYSQFLKDD